MFREITEYMINNYNQEVLEAYNDKNNARKNRIKNEKKLEEIKTEIEQVFKVDDLMTDFKPGMNFNYSDNPWVCIHNELNMKGTSGEYIGVSFNRNTKCLEFWFGFGITNTKLKRKLKKNEISTKRNEYIAKLRTIEPYLKRGFSYTSLTFADAIMISKSIKLDSIDENEVREDLYYLANIYITYENKYNRNNKDKFVVEDSYISEDEKIEGRNVLYVGAPATGKSYLVNKTYLTKKDGTKIDESKYEIVVFYPEYSYANFIGSILPIIKEDKVSYDFVPGIFTKILKRAIEHPKSSFYLVIEELNRGNASAIFGDVFLLLDRENGTNGKSVYEISNESMAKYIFGSSNKKVYLPNNLSIIATTNASDQNTIPLDSAFKRRWEPVYVIDEDKTEIDNLYIKGLNIKWGKFREVINHKMSEIFNGNINVEDKKICAYHIDKSYLSENRVESIEDKERFIYKIYTYLYNDVFKYDKSIIFNEDIINIDLLIKKAKYNMLSVFKEEVVKEFNEDDKN